MKLVLAALFCGLSFSTGAIAQTRKMSPPPQSRPNSVSSIPTYSAPSYARNEISGNLGLVAGAINLGVTYIRPLADFGFGGYAFIQSSKDKNTLTIVNGVTALGGLIKVNIFENHSIRAYLAPGFGFAMIKDGSNNGATKSDETAIGASLKTGVQFKLSSDFMIGLEAIQFSNWFNSNVSTYSHPTYLTAVGSLEF